MNKKKVLKVIGIILLIIFIMFLVHTIRNYIIITDLQNKISKYSETENLVESEYEFNNVDDSIFVEPDISQYMLKEKYSIKDKDFNLYKNEDDTRYENYRGIKLLEYDNSNNDYAEIYYISYDYTTDPSFYYTLEITDESNKNLLIEGEKEQQIIGGMVSAVKIRKINENHKINFSVFEKNIEGNIVNSAQIQIDLKKDLEEKVKIDQRTNLKSGKLGDVSFQYIDSEYTYFGTTEHAYSDKLVGETASLPIKIQYGNRLIPEEHIEFLCYKNVNKLSLEEALESLVLINNNFGQYGLSDIYGMDITDKQGQVIDTVTISFDEMIKLCNGLTIEKAGKEYTKESFERFEEITMVKDKNVEIGNKIDAIKYYFESNEDEESYMFIYKDNIYDIRIPTNKRIDDEVQLFLDSIKEIN